MSELEIIEDPSEALAVGIRDLPLEPSAKANVLDAYVPHFSNARALVARAKELFDNPSDPASDAKTARVLRLSIKEARVGSEKTRKKLKEDVLLYGKAIDGVHACVKLLTEPVEARLQAIEDAEAIAAQKKRDELRARRTELLTPYCATTEHYALDTMPEEGFEALLSGMKAAHELRVANEKRAEEQRLEALRLAEEERVKKEKAAAEEKARLEAENARLQAERDRLAETARQEREQAAKEHQRLLAEQAEKERAAQAERDRLAEIARQEREQAAKLRAEADRLAAEERRKREELEASLEAERLAEEERVRRAAAAPDREKLLAFASSLRALSIPELSTEHGPAHRISLLEDLERLAKRAEFIGNHI